MTGLPPGFVLDQPAAAPAQPASMGLPEGFVLDSPAPVAAATQKQPDSIDIDDPKSPLYASRHGGSAVTFLADSIGHTLKSAFTLPGDVATGKVDPYSEEAAGRALDMAAFSPVAPNKLSWTKAGAAVAAPAEKAAPSVAEAASRIDVAIPRAVASDNRMVQAAGAGVRNVPFAGEPLMKAAENTISQLGTAADRVAANMGGATRAEAGAGAREALEVGWKGRTSATQDALYGKVDAAVNPQATVPLEGTRGVVSQILADRTAQRVSDPGKAVSFVLDAVQDANGLTYEGIKGLRTRVGEMLKDRNALASTGVSEQELKAVYGGLSDDLRAAVQSSGGPEGLAAFNKANAYAANVAARRERLQPIVGATSDEGVVERLAAAASSKGRADISLLTQARKAIGPEAWDDVAGSVVSRLGRDAEGQFSPQRFLTDFNKLSPEGRALLFNSTGKGDLARSLTDIATVSSRFKELQKYANPSGTGRQAVFGGAAAGGVAMEPVTVISSLVGANVLARILARPASASSMSKWAVAYERAVKTPSAGAVAALDRASRNFSATVGGEGGGLSYEALIGSLTDSAGLGMINTASERSRLPAPR